MFLGPLFALEEVLWDFLAAKRGKALRWWIVQDGLDGDDLASGQGLD